MRFPNAEGVVMVKRFFITCIVCCFFITGTSVYAQSGFSQLSGWYERLRLNITSSMNPQDRLSSIEEATTTDVEQVSLSAEETIKEFGLATVLAKRGVIENYQNDYTKRLLQAQETISDFDLEELEVEMETDVKDIEADVFNMLDELLSEYGYQK